MWTTGLCRLPSRTAWWMAGPFGSQPAGYGEVDCPDQATVLLARYRVWLVGERGLASDSVRCYCCQASKFLAWLPDPLDASLARLDAAVVTAFVVDQAAAAKSVWSAKRW